MLHSEQDSSPPTHNVRCELLRDIAYARFRRSEEPLTEDIRDTYHFDSRYRELSGCWVFDILWTQ